MKTLNVIVLLFFAFDFIETECPVSILPDFCSDQVRNNDYLFVLFSVINFLFVSSTGKF